jgi:hypothetical protein
MYMKRLTLPAFGLLLSLLMATAFFIPVEAQSKSSITISPLREEGEIDPGFVYSGSLLIKNSGTSAQHISLSAETFNVTNQSYDYLFKTGTAESQWVTFDQSSLSLAPNEFTTISYQVSVPIGAEPGGYYLALFALNTPSGSTTGGIIPTERVASLLYLTVSGEATRSGQLIQLQSPLVIFGEASWSATLQNNGTLHYRTFYSSKVSSVLDQQLSFHEDTRLILPGSVRLIEAPIQAPEILGLYKITYTVSLGDNPSREETRWFLYLPPLQIALIALIVAGLVVIKKQYRRPA